MRFSIITLLLLALTGFQFYSVFQPLASVHADDDECLVPCDEIVGGGPPKDGIPAIDSPRFISATDYESSGGTSEDLVIGVYFERKARAYPTDILNWHEIVNDNFNGVPISVTYCPLTWSSIAYQTASLGEDHTLGTTGKLYENNLVFYDRQSETYWSQLLGQGIKGEHKGESLPTIPVVQTTWSAWKAMYPSTVVLSENTGYSRNYDRNPYDAYQQISDENIWFPTSYDWRWKPYNRYPPKTHAFVLSLNNETRLYSFEELAQQNIVNDIFGNQTNQSAVIAFDTDNEAAVAFSFSLNGIEYTFTSKGTTNLDKLETFDLKLFQDEETKSVWNMRGQAISGDLKGAQLEPLSGYNAFWFAATVFSQKASLFQAELNDAASSSESSETGLESVDLVLLIGALGLAAWLGYFKNKR